VYSFGRAALLLLVEVFPYGNAVG